MTSDEAITFLKSRQPMPLDFDITDAEGAMYVSILQHFEAHPDERCLPLLINSVSSDTGLGMYEHIGFVLMAHPREKVIPLHEDQSRLQELLHVHGPAAGGGEVASRVTG